MVPFKTLKIKCDICIEISFHYHLNSENLYIHNFMQATGADDEGMSFLVMTRT